MARGKRVEAGQSLPATVPDKTAISLRNNLFPGQDVTLNGNRSLAEGAIALHRDAWTKSQLVLAKNAAIQAEANATAAVAKARKANAEASLAEAEVEAKAKSEMAKARKANAEASLAEAEAQAKAKVADAEAQSKAKVADAEARTADAEARVAEAQAATKIRVAAAEAREADLKILKLTKEIDVFIGECVSSVFLSLYHCRFSDPFSPPLFLLFLPDRCAAGRRR